MGLRFVLKLGGESILTMVFIIWKSIVNPHPYTVLRLMIYKIIIEPVVLCGCEVPVCMLREQHTWK